MLTLFFIIFVFLFFIPLRSVPFLPVAPINAIVYPFVLYALLNAKRIYRVLSPALVLLLVVYLGFVCLDTVFSYIKQAEAIKVFGQIRVTIFAFLIFIYARTFKNYKFAFKLVLFLICLNTVLGLLIYFVGEPFQSLRLWIIGTAETYKQVRGSRVAGLSASIFAFSYQIAPAVVMAFGLYAKERKWIWLAIFAILVLGLILNGERSSALMSSLSLSVMLFTHFRKSIRLFLALLLVVFLVVGTAKYTFLRPMEQLSQNQTLLHRLDTEQQGGLMGRILQGTAGILTVVKNPLTGGTERQYQKEVHQLFRRYAGAAIPESIEIPAPHNHYVNIGMHAGLTGIVIFLLFLYLLLRIARRFWENCRLNPELRDYFIITLYSLVAVMGNALFHNHGLFFAETTSWALIGLIGAGSIMEAPSSKADNNA